jgi:hypothetical protein
MTGILKSPGFPTEEISEDSKHHGLVTDFEKTLALFAHLSQQQHEILGLLAPGDVDVDEWSQPGNPVSQTIYNTVPNFYQPIVVEHIFATWPITSTAVTLQLGDRIIPILNLTAGLIAVDVRMQLEWDDIRRLTIAPAGLAFLEVMGHMDNKKVDRP